MPTYIVEYGKGYRDGDEIVQTETLDISYCDSLHCMASLMEDNGFSPEDDAGQAIQDDGIVVSWGRVYCPETSSDEYCPICGTQVTTGVNGE
jgi:hypothetical protein